MSRRARGEGSVYKDGNRWVARIDLGVGADGKRRQVKRKLRTKTEAHAELRKLQGEANVLENLQGQRRTVADAVASFLLVGSNGRSEKTIAMELWRSELILKGLGRQQLSKLSVLDCDEFLTRASHGEYGRKPLGKDSTRRVRSLLINVLRNEQRTGRLTQNVAELSVLPGWSPTEIDDDEDGDSSTSSHRALTHAEFRELWRSARWPLLVLVDLSGRNGLRPSEARALRWSEIDLDGQTLTVRRQMAASNKVTKAKTKRSVRTNPIDDRTAVTLGRWRELQEEKRRIHADRWADTGLVVTTRYGTPINAANFRRMVDAAGTEAGIPKLVPYELRHTAITFQIDAGRDTWEVADWAGTSQRMIEETYRHRLNRVTNLRPADIEDLDDV